MPNIKGAQSIVINSLTRSKKSVTILLVVIVTLTLLHTFKRDTHIGPESPPTEKYDGFNIIQNRATYKNPVIQDWIKSDKYNTIKNEGSLSTQCNAYFDKLDKIKKPGSPTARLNDEFAFNPLLFKKKKWFRERTKEIRKKLSRQGLKFTDQHQKELEDEFERDLKKLASVEYAMVREIDTARIFGKCYLDANLAKPDANEHIECAKHERSIYPWLYRSWPQFEDWDGQSLPDGEIPIYNQTAYEPSESPCFMSRVKSMSNGRGIVIPIVPSNDKRLQVDNTISLMRVLRGLQNTLPIEIMFADGQLKKDDKERIISAARGEMPQLPKSYHHYIALSNQEVQTDAESFPKQDVWFVDLANEKYKSDQSDPTNYHITKDPTFVSLLASLFHSFEESIILSPQAIPMVAPTRFFDMAKYRLNGYLFFKKPSHYQDNKTRKFPPGFHEITNLIKTYLMPSQHDHDLFGLIRRSKRLSLDTNRFLEDSFQMLMDASVMVTNKKYVLRGFLIGCNLQSAKILSSRVHVPEHSVNPEMFWLAQEVAGTTEKVRFNRHFGVAVGVITPPSNVNPNDALLSEELCSFSWGQLSEDDDYTLLYVTSHQLENWKHDHSGLETALRTKFVRSELQYVDNVFGKEGQSSVMVDNTELYDSTIMKTPLYIDSVLNPPVMKAPVFIQGSAEPNQAWLKSEAYLGHAHEFWCAYNIVGSIDLTLRGKFVHYNDRMKAWFNYVLDLWVG